MSINEYRHRAEECERLAKQILPGEGRTTILKIAASWRDLADSCERAAKVRGGGEAGV